MLQTSWIYCVWNRLISTLETAIVIHLKAVDYSAQNQ